MMYYQSKKTDWKQDGLLMMKSDIQSILKALHLDGKLEYKKTAYPFAHPKQQGIILYNRKEIGTLYSLHPNLFAEYKITDDNQICYTELDIPALLTLNNQSKKQIKNYETLQDQIIWRDLCFVIDGDQDFSGIIESAKSIREVEDIEIFDLYEGEYLPEGKKSLAFKFKVKGENLKTEEINTIMHKVIEKVEKTGAKLR